MTASPAPRRRAVLRDLTVDAAEDILAGRRRPGWSPGYPTSGDRDISRWLTRHPPGDGIDPLYLPKQIMDADSGLVVGGIGCHQPPDEELSVEIGYGVAPESRNQGITTEAVGILVEALRLAGIRLVVARTSPANPPSQSVLRHNGFRRVGVDRGGLLIWHLALGD